jgi:DNA repair protein RecO (recombination protein O)
VIVDTEAIVLRGRDYSDSSRILGLYTLSHGRLSVIVKGVKKVAARHGLSLEPMSHIRAVLYVKDHRDLQLLSKFEPLESLGGLMADMDRMAAGLAVVELIGAVTPQAEANDALFHLVASTLRTLKAATKQPRNALYHFEVHLLGQLGFQPEFESCASCGKQVGESAGAVRGTARMGHAGVVCPACIERHHGLFPISREALAVLRDFQRMGSADEAAGRPVSAMHAEEIDAALRRCLQMNIETLGKLRSREVFHALGRTL